MYLSFLEGSLPYLSLPNVHFGTFTFVYLRGSLLNIYLKFVYSGARNRTCILVYFKVRYGAFSLKLFISRFVIGGYCCLFQGSLRDVYLSSTVTEWVLAFSLAGFPLTFVRDFRTSVLRSPRIRKRDYLEEMDDVLLHCQTLFFKMN